MAIANLHQLQTSVQTRNLILTISNEYSLLLGLWFKILANRFHLDSKIDYRI